MHIVVSWDIQAQEPRWSEINDELKKAFESFSWVRPLTTFYVVKLFSESDRRTVANRLMEVAQNSAETVHIVVSPAMVGGQYDGWLPSEMWPKVNSRTQ